MNTKQRRLSDFRRNDQCLSAAAWRILSVALLIIAVRPSTVDAQQPVVRLNLEAMSLRTRTGGPIGLHIKLNYNRDELLEGDLLLEVYDGRRQYEMLLAAVRYDGIVLQGSDAIFRVLLPPLPTPTTDSSYDIAAWFETDKERIPLSATAVVADLPDTFSILSSNTYQRSAVLLSATGRPDPMRISAFRTRMHALLSPQSILPEKKRSELIWVPSSRSGYSMPEDPLELCCCDLVLLADGSLKQLEEPQLQALETWVQAGGSLCVVPTDEGLNSRHLEFLRRLLPNDQDRLLLNDSGTITVLDTDTKYCAAYAGLGRCVLIPHGIRPLTDLTADEQTWLREFLWKARGCRYPRSGETLADVSRQAAALRRPQNPDEEFDPYRSDQWQRNAVGAQDTGFVQMCQSALMPSDVTVVPTSVILVLLAAYILAVGPVDYTVLGFFRIRRFTWILFPLVTLAFTMMMIAVAHHYLGSSETGKQLLVTDVGSDGQPLRSSLIDLQFVGTRRDSTTEHQSALVSSMSTEPLNFTGRFPHDYTANRRLEQWSPDLTRTLTLTPDPIPDLGIDWNDPQLITTEPGRQNLRQLLVQQQHVRCVHASVMHESGGHQIINVPQSAYRDPPNDYAYMSMHVTGDVLPTTAASCSHPEPNGLFRYFSQVSPGGAAFMEDLPLFDKSNTDQWLLSILVETDAGYHLIRKLYCLPETSRRDAPDEPSAAAVNRNN